MTIERNIKIEYLLGLLLNADSSIGNYFPSINFKMKITGWDMDEE